MAIDLNKYLIDDVEKTFSRLFVLAVHQSMNLFAFTYLLSKSNYVAKLEEGDIDAISNWPIEKAYFDATKETVKDDSYGIYNDAYWSGYSYFELFLKTHKPFSYLFLKLPLEKMLDIYEIFHEMDFTSLLEYFKKRETENTILGVLCKNKKCSLTKLKEATGISVNTLSKYRSSDEILYKASFQNIYKLARYFEVPISLFVDSL